jgi:hypothetical protein
VRRQLIAEHPLLHLIQPGILVVVHHAPCDCGARAPGTPPRSGRRRAWGLLPQMVPRHGFTRPPPPDSRRRHPPFLDGKGRASRRISRRCRVIPAAEDCPAACMRQTGAQRGALPRMGQHFEAALLGLHPVMHAQQP